MNKHAAFVFGLSWLVTVSCQSETSTPSGGAGSSSAGVGGGGAGTAGSSSLGGSGVGPQAGTASQNGGSSGSSSGAGTQAGSSSGEQGGVSGGGGGGAGGASGGAGGGGGADLPPLEECQGKASIDRLTSWQASGEGLTVPATGSILVQEGADYVGKVQFVGAEWHVIPVLIANQFGETVDLSNATGITLTYSATAELHVQLRSESHWSGGDQYATTIPSTGGQKKTQFFSLAAAGWASLFGAPALSFADTLKEGMGLVFVGNSENTVAFYGLRIDGYSPPCE